MMNCPNCGAENRDGAPYCRLCATPLPAPGMNPQGASYQPPFNQPEAAPAQITCPVCRTVNDGGWAFCQECGTKLLAARPKTEQVPSQPDMSGQATIVMKDAGTSPVKQGGYNPVTTVADPFSTSIEDATATRIDDTGMATRVDDSYASRTMVDDSMATRIDNNLVASILEQQNKAGGMNPADFKTVISDINPADLTTAPDVKDKPPLGSETVFDANPSFANIIAESKEAVCPNCSHKSAPGSMFCANCGTRLAAARPSMPPQPAPPQPPVAKPAEPEPSAAETMWRVSVPPASNQGKLYLVMEGGQQGEVYDLKDTTVVGRTSGDLSFPHDGYMSGRHAQIVRRGSDFFLSDAGSRNGTFIRIKGEVKLEPGDMVLIGKQLFRFEKS